MSKFTSGHALAIGAGADLPNTVTDAVGIANLLQDAERCAYPADQVHLLAEDKATRADILTALEQLADRAGAEATVVFYFSGHGYEVSMPIGKQYFLMPYGYQTNDLLNTAISGQELMAKLQAIKAQKMLILLDCCHAGGIDDAAEKAPGIQFVKAPLPEGAVAALGKGHGRVIISSCKAYEKSYTGEPYSQFTQALLEAFAGAGLSKADGYVRAADLALYAAKTVPQYTKDKQNPVLHFDQADNFVVGYYAAGDTRPKGLSPKEQRRGTPQDDAATRQPGTTTTVAAENTGSGSIAQGAGSRSTGAGGVIAETIHGDVMTGENARKINAKTYIERQDVRDQHMFDQRGQTVHGSQANFAGNVNTSGGMINTGNINTEGGDFVGRDKLGGDKVSGDKYVIDNISGRNLAIGRGATVTINASTPTEDPSQNLQPLLLIAQSIGGTARSAAIKQVEELQQELRKGGVARDKVIGGLLQSLARSLPDATGTIVEIFKKPVLAAMIGPVTEFVLEQFEAK